MDLIFPKIFEQTNTYQYAGSDSDDDTGSEYSYQSAQTPRQVGDLIPVREVAYVPISEENSGNFTEKLNEVLSKNDSEKPREINNTSGGSYSESVQIGLIDIDYKKKYSKLL